MHIITPVAIAVVFCPVVFIMVQTAVVIDWEPIVNNVLIGAKWVGSWLRVVDVDHCAGVGI